METIAIKTFGDVATELTLNNFLNGTHYYSLEVDGRLVKTLPVQVVR
ncbi:MAG: hypothetical protein AAGJ18_12810 [Bacteroidota bacterium]